MGAAEAEVRGRDGIRWCWGAGWEGRQYGSPDLCACRYQRPLHLAVSKPLQKNNKLWTLFDRRLLQMKTGQQMHAWWNGDEVVEVGVGGGDTKQSGQTGPDIWERGHLNTTPSSLSSSSLAGDGGKTENRKFHINTKKSQCKQSDE